MVEKTVLATGKVCGEASERKASSAVVIVTIRAGLVKLMEVGNFSLEKVKIDWQLLGEDSIVDYFPEEGKPVSKIHRADHVCSDFKTAEPRVNC